MFVRDIIDQQVLLLLAIHDFKEGLRRHSDVLSEDDINHLQNDLLPTLQAEYDGLEDKLKSIPADNN